MALEAIFDAISTKWTRNLLGLAFSALGAVGVYAYTQVNSWVEQIKSDTSTTAKKDYEQDLKLERLTLLVESTSKTVDKLADTLERQGDKRDERARRMDRLLDVLERKGYNPPKKESE